MMKLILTLVVLTVIWSEISADAEASPARGFRFKLKNRCCRSAKKFKRLFNGRNKNLRTCSRQRSALLSKIKGLKSALNAQEVVITIKPPNLPAPNVDQLVFIRDRAVEVLRSATFTNITTTQQPPLTTTTTPKPPTTRLRTTTTTPITTTSTSPEESTTGPAGSKTTTTDRYGPTEPANRISTTEPWRTRYPPNNYHKKYERYEEEEDYDDSEDMMEQPDFEDELENEDEVGRKRKRRSNPQPLNCPSIQATRQTISNLPPGSRIDFIANRNSLIGINSNIARSCAECHYQVTLPARHYPRTHRHVVCPGTKLNCFGGFGRCANNDVATTIFVDTTSPAVQFDWDSVLQITFNKGCGCQMLQAIVFLGDGN